MKTRDLVALKRNTDLVSVVQSRGVALTRKGNDYVGLCPFHEEVTPSFHVTPRKNLFHCFGCDAAGSVIDFVMRREGLTFREAVDRLLTETGVVQRGVSLGSTRVPPMEEDSSLSPERAQVLLERVVTIYAKTFGEVSEGRAYLEKRGITDAGLWTQHRVGYCNGRLPELLPNEGSIRDELKTLGILLADGRERFTGCVVFPVCDTEGRIVTLYARHTGAEGEKRHFYLPGRPTGLWNSSALKTYAHAILVESVFDALSVMMAGPLNVLAIQGTNGFGPSDVAVLKEHGVQRVTLLLDGDAAGRAGVARLRPLLSSFSCESRELPENHDPNSFLVAHGTQGLATFLVPVEPPPAAAGAPVQPLPGGFAMTLGLRRYEVRGLEKGPRKLRATVRVEHAGKLHVDTLDFYSARWRRQLAQDLTRLLDESAETIEADIAKLMSFCDQAEAGGACTLSPSSPISSLTPEARAEAEAFGKDPHLFENILADFERCGLVGERANKLLCYLASVSRKMDKPLSVLVLSSSGAGKTTLQDVTLAFCPPEDLLKLTSLSGKALFYKEASSLKHKILALEEGDGVEEAMYALRNLISAGELVTEATIKDPVTGRLTTMANRVEGPTAVFLTTTNPEIDPETKSRFFVTSVDESREQTQAILMFQRRRHTLAGLEAGFALKPILQKHQNFQRLLKPVAVVNPYADQLSYGDDRLQSRRDQPKYLNLIKAVAFLRQMQKEVTTPLNAPGGASQEYIEVDREDIRRANELATHLLGHSLDELSRPAHDLLMQLTAMTRPGPVPAAESEELSAKEEKSGHHVNGVQAPPAFTRRQIREFTGWSHARVHRYLAELIELEFVLMEHGRNGVLHRYRLAYEGQGQDGKKFLLGLKEVEALREPSSVPGA